MCVILTINMCVCIGVCCKKVDLFLSSPCKKKNDKINANKRTQKSNVTCLSSTPMPIPNSMPWLCPLNHCPT